MNKTLIIVFIGLLLIPTIFVSGCTSNTVTSSSMPIKSASQQPTIFGQAAFCPNPPTPTVTDKNVRQAPSMSEPAPRTPYTDPVFGTCVVRVTDRAHDIAADDRSKGLKNEYSTVQSFNADETKLIALALEGTWYLYDAHTLEPLGRMPITGSAVRWDATDPNIVYYFSVDVRSFWSYNIQTKETKLVHDFTHDVPSSAPYVWPQDYGSSTKDGRYWAFIAENQNWMPVAFIIYDKQTDKISAMRDVTGQPYVKGISISPLGNYFIASFPDEACPAGGGDESHPCSMMVYDRSLTHGRSLTTREGGCVGHGDCALDANGREVYVFQDSCTDNIAMIDLATRTLTNLLPLDFSSSTGMSQYSSIHISGRALDRPGWVLVSTTDETTTSRNWMDDQVFAVELKPSGRIVRLAHDYTVVDPKQEHDYWAEPHGSVNRDFTRVLFTSNWGRSGTEQVEMYMVVLPKGWG
jgi:hypothetical protein